MSVKGLIWPACRSLFIGTGCAGISWREPILRVARLIVVGSTSRRLDELTLRADRRVSVWSTSISLAGLIRLRRSLWSIKSSGNRMSGLIWRANSRILVA